MSTRYPGGVITKTPVVPAGPYETGAAPGIWTLDQQLQAAKAGIWPTAGVQPDYIEDVFSTYLYTGNGSTQTITNGIDLSTKGGLTWIKSRTTAFNHTLVDTVRGATNLLVSNTTAAQATQANSLTAFTSTGFSIGAGSIVNFSADNFVSWTFREQPKFFDVVTFTSSASGSTTITHNLNSIPGCVITKATAAVSNWVVQHAGLPSNKCLLLNTTGATIDITGFEPTYTTTTITFPSGYFANTNTAHVAYIYANNAGGFGLTGTDNVISCGSYTGTGATGNNVTLGYEPQWLMIKAAERAQDWFMFDVMRGMTTTGGTEEYLVANASDAAGSGAFGINPTSTGFGVNATGTSFNASGEKYIYIAIRRGPMKVPTDATKVFLPNDGTGSTSGQSISTSFPVDLAMSAYKTQGFVGLSNDRLRGIGNTNTAGLTPALQTSTTQAESAFSPSNPWFINAWNNSITRGSNGVDPVGGIVTWLFGRAPGFFDEVCWTGTNADQTLTHNLTVAPELIIYKTRATTSNWYTARAFTSSNYSNLQLNLTTAGSTVAYSGSGPFSAQPTTTQFSVGQFYNPTSAMVAYLFATVAGVSKVGSYTGNGTTQVINCGFTAGARFVLIKRTDSTGDWYVWDSARGIVAGNDPYLLLNSTAAEVTGTDYVDTAASGFEISSTAPAAINANGGSFIFLAIA